MKLYYLINIILLMAGLGVYSSCEASSKQNLTQFFESQKEEGYAKCLNDSVANILINANKINCQLMLERDSTDTDSIVKLSPQLNVIIKYLFLDKKNFQSNDIVYGVFQPWAVYKFKHKKQEVLLELDFGLKKWKLKNSKGETITQADIEGNNQQLQRFTSMLFPKNNQLKLSN